MHIDVVKLSRAQFAMTVMFHYLFPPLTIGIGVVMVYLEGMFLKTGQEIYEQAAKFWTQLFAVTFAVGVASGIVMEFQFGTNWAVYSRFVGDVFGSALAAEGIFAFFLESGFLAVLVFGWDRVSKPFHFFATLMVSLGSMFSAVWIVVANSWQQTPAGHHVVQMTRDGQPWFDFLGKPIVRAEVVDFWSVVLNPSTIDRLTHTLIGAFIMGAFFIMSISAYYILRGRHMEFAKRSFSGALIFGTIFSLAQLLSGHSNALMVAKQQPAKLAAFEAHFKTEPAALTVFGWPDQKTGTVKGQIAVPGLLSFMVHNNTTTPVVGLDKVPKEYWPPILVSFVSYRTMIGIGTFFILLTVFATIQLWRGKLFEQRWLLAIFVPAVLLAVAANQLGWIAAEVGRQPWAVYPPVVRDAQGAFTYNDAGFLQYHMEDGLLTRKAVSESVKAPQVLGSIFMFGAVYLMLLALWVVVLNHKIHHGPHASHDHPPVHGGEGILDAASDLMSHKSSLSKS